MHFLLNSLKRRFIGFDLYIKINKKEEKLYKCIHYIYIYEGKQKRDKEMKDIRVVFPRGLIGELDGTKNWTIFVDVLYTNDRRWIGIDRRGSVLTGVDNRDEILFDPVHRDGIKVTVVGSRWWKTVPSSHRFLVGHLVVAIVFPSSSSPQK